MQYNKLNNVVCTSFCCCILCKPFLLKFEIKIFNINFISSVGLLLSTSQHRKRNLNTKNDLHGIEL